MEKSIQEELKNKYIQLASKYGELFNKGDDKGIDKIYDELEKTFYEILKSDWGLEFFKELLEKSDDRGVLYITASKMIPFFSEEYNQIFNKMSKVNDLLFGIMKFEFDDWKKGKLKYNYDTNKFYLADDKEK